MKNVKLTNTERFHLYCIGHAMDNLRDGQECDDRGCKSHISHPCEGCGRIGASEKLTKEYYNV